MIMFDGARIHWSNFNAHSLSKLYLSEDRVVVIPIATLCDKHKG